MAEVTRAEMREAAIAAGIPADAADEMLSRGLVPMTAHEMTALKLADFGFAFPATEGAMARMAAIGLAEKRGDGRWHVTGSGRLAMRGLHPALTGKDGTDG